MIQATGQRNKKLWTIVLAAGASSRLGRPKQLLRISGESLLNRMTRLASKASASRTIVVIGAQAGRMRAHLGRSRIRTLPVHNSAWQTGMGSSLRAGIAALPNDATGVMVLLTDQPGVTTALIERLLEAWQRQPSRIVACRYRGQLGVPAVFPRRVFRLLRQIDGDRGARAILNSAKRVVAVDSPNAAFDIDTEADMAALLKT